MEWYIVDVFVDPEEDSVLHGGNQLGVVLLEDQSHSTQQLQAIATEIGYSETTFVYKDTISYQQRSARVVISAKTRIFTIEQELPFAGHPTLGTAWMLKYLHKQKEPSVTVSSVNVDLPLLGQAINVSFNSDTGVGTMTQAQPKFGEKFSTSVLYEKFGISDGIIGEPQVVSTGIPFLICRLATFDDVVTISDRLNKNSFNSFMSESRDELLGVYFFAEGGLGLRSRMLFFEGGVFTEDPATGSASGCCLSYLLENGEAKQQWIVEQGVEMGRRSLVLFSGEKKENHYTIQIGGSCVLVSQGTWLGKGKSV